jgi:hypothetical protein
MIATHGFPPFAEMSKTHRNMTPEERVQEKKYPSGKKTPILLISFSK